MTDDDINRVASMLEDEIEQMVENLTSEIAMLQDKVFELYHENIVLKAEVRGLKSLLEVLGYD